MCKSHHVTTDKGVDGRTHHNPDDFASPIVKVAFVEKLLAPRLLAEKFYIGFKLFQFNNAIRIFRMRRYRLGVWAAETRVVTNNAM